MYADIPAGCAFLRARISVSPQNENSRPARWSAGRLFVCRKTAAPPDCRRSRKECYFAFALLNEYTKLIVAVFCSLTVFSFEKL